MKNHTRSLALMIGLLFSALALAACAPKLAPTAVPVAVVTAAPPAASDFVDFPSGRFMAAHDPTSGYLFDNVALTWTYVYAGTAGETVSATGSYTVQGNQWIENGTSTAEECPFPAAYKWSFDGANLSFTLVGEDKCNQRKQLTDGRTFVRVP